MSYGFTFNNQHSSSFHIVMKSVNRTLLPAKRRDGYAIPGRDGTYYGSDTPDYENRQIIVRISFRGEAHNLESLRERIRKIAKWLSATSGQLIFDDEPDKAYTASVDSGLNLNQLMTWGECELTFNCQPFAESIEYQTVTKTITATTDDMAVSVSGTQDSYGIITIKNEGTTNITGITIQRKVEVS